MKSVAMWAQTLTSSLKKVADRVTGRGANAQTRGTAQTSTSKAH
jgi:hypothetical protein